MNEDRIDSVADAISSLGYDGITKFDTSEPEYDVIVSATERFDSDSHLALMFILAATEDYQLAGDAQDFWSALHDTLQERERLESESEVNSLLSDFMQAPVNTRLRNQKQDRLIQLVENGFGEWFLTTYPDHDPEEVWQQLADGLETSKSKKTIVFAMKVYDIYNLVTDGHYLDLPVDVPIPCDLQVKRVASSAGIVDSEDEESVMSAWEKVMRRVNDSVEQPVSMLRIDSIVWQAGQIISENNDHRESSQEDLEEYFQEVGLDVTSSELLASELTESL